MPFEVFVFLFGSALKYSHTTSSSATLLSSAVLCISSWFSTSTPTLSFSAVRLLAVDIYKVENGENGGERKGSGRDHGHGLLIGQGPSEGALLNDNSAFQHPPSTGRLGALAQLALPVAETKK